MATVDERRRRCLDIRRERIDNKRRRILGFRQELDSLSGSPPPITVASPARRASGDTGSSSSGVVVALPASARKSARKMSQDPVAVSVGRGEAKVLGRVHELQQQGLWPSKKLAKIQMPPRPKTHWDFVIEEMNWLSSVILQERKTKKLVCKKCSKMVQRHFTDKEAALVRAEKAHEQNLRKIAASYAREVRNFWGNVEKLFEFTVKTQIEAKRKQALDQHLNFIVDRTEKFSTLLAESMADNQTNVSSRRTTPNVSDAEMDDNDDYEPDQNSDDDEATIAREEDTHEDGELDELNAEADIPLEDLLKKFHPELFEGKDDDESNETNENDEFKPTPSTSSGGPSTSSSTTRSGRRTKSQAVEDLDEAKDEDSLKRKDDLKTLMGEENKDFYDVVEMAAQFQPTGNTLDTTNVKTPVPFLLKHTLREYQHIGLDWLVSLHERKLNGILADEMGLGKTIQTIAFLAHMACERHVWGPHLIVVPTSVMLNWEMEIKKWAPAFKVLTYFGSQKERKLKRVGWTKPNAFHICVTSYKLVTQDHSSFRRKQWQYLILDEAQHIKNFKSQRWQLLLNFPSVGRLLLTGTPLQNNLMELWSLMHFLMPNIFESHRDFKEWFSNPLTGMVEGSAEYNEGLIQRLHKVLRPFLLRRLKNEVEKQLPKKYEHIVKCPLSKRQRYLYDDFMSRAKTKETLESGNLLSVINVLMQLRKVCNHPNLFEPRPTVSPFIQKSVEVHIPKMYERASEYHPLINVDVSYSPLAMANHEFNLTAFAAHRMNRLRVLKPTVDAHILFKGAGLPLPCPRGKLRMTVRSTVNTPVPTTKIVENKIPFQTLINNNLWKSKGIKEGGILTIKTTKGTFILCPKSQTVQQVIYPPPVTTVHMQVEAPPVKKIQVSLPSSPIKKPSIETNNGSEEQDVNGEPKKKRPNNGTEVPKVRPKGIFTSGIFASETAPLTSLSPRKRKATAHGDNVKLEPPKLVKERLVQNLIDKVSCLMSTNDRRCNACPLYGKDLVEAASIFKCLPDLPKLASLEEPSEFSVFDMGNSLIPSSMHELLEKLKGFMSRFHMYVPPAVALVDLMTTESLNNFFDDVDTHWLQRMTMMPLLQMPETRLIQYDCGKLQALARLLQQLKAGSHRVLIFTQMTKVLDVLESFLNYHGHTYLRLDGSTKVEQRQVLMERFNANSKYFVFILSTRSGGVGINLTGADTVIFYDSDWNPTMDAQAQDRCHRIGQTRDVHIYRLISERSIEENIVKKANQKRLLGDLAIEGGNFTTAFFKKQTIRDLFEVEQSETAASAVEVVRELPQEADDGSQLPQEVNRKAAKAFESAIAAVEDNTDLEALKKASQEVAADEAEFDEEIKPDDGLGTLMKQLTAVERYALNHIEHVEKYWKESQLAAADADIEAQKREFDAKKLEDMAEAIGAVSATPTEEGSTASESDDSDDDRSSSSDDEEDDTDDSEADTEDEAESSREDDGSSDQGESMESEEDEEDRPIKSSAATKSRKSHDNAGTPLSPRTRSRGDVRINLWSLDD